MKPVIELLFATTVQAALSPTYESITNANFPKFTNTPASDAWAIGGTNAANKDIYDDMYQSSSKALLAKFMQNDSSKLSGLYHVFRVSKLSAAPTQSLALGANDGKTNSKITSIQTAKVKTFYQTDKDGLGNWNDMKAAVINDAAKLKGDSAGNAVYGDMYTGCEDAAIAVVASNWKAAWSITSGILDTGSSNGFKTTSVPNRVLLNSGKSTGGSVTCGDVSFADYKQCQYFGFDKDLILASFYQSNGDSNTSGETWCSGTWLRQPDVGVKETLKGQKGFGPRGKCTWQVIAKVNNAGPAIGLTATPNSNMLVQVIEWYNVAQLTGNALINPTKAAAAPGYIAKTADDYKASLGVFFNPITVVKDAPAASTDATKFSKSSLLPFTTASSIFSAVYRQDNAYKSVTNSLGNAQYYEQDLGETNQMLRTIDSAMFTEAYAVYAAVKSGYETLKSTYDTDKTAYETAVEDRKKDPKKTLPTRPNMPSQPAAYSGPQLILSTQNVASPAKSWADYKTVKSINGVLVTDVSSGVYSFDQTNLAKTFHNRIGYLQASKTTAAAAGAGVGATFGRLGQGKNTMYDTGKPFLWNKAETDARPGMMVSLFPEYVRTAGTSSSTTQPGWNDWDVSSTQPTIEAGVKTFQTAADFDMPTQPGAATPIKDAAAQMTAATLFATGLALSALY